MAFCAELNFVQPFCPTGTNRLLHRARCPRHTSRVVVRRPRACESPPSPAEVLDILKNATQSQKILALISLRKLSSEQAVPVLYSSGILDIDNIQVRVTALTTLGKVGARKEADTLIAVLLNDIDHSIRAAAASALGSLLFCEGDFVADETTGKTTEALLHAATKDEHFIVRYTAIVSAGNIADPAVVPALLPIANDIAAPTLEAAAALTALGEVVPTRDVGSEMLKAVCARAGDREEFIRAAVARTLGRWTGVGGARASLEKMKTDEEKYGQSNLVRAILSDVLGEEIQ